MQKRMIRIFISSTFEDFREERDLLTTEVFPELEELCTKNNFSFQVIDLRWGVSKEAALKNQSLQICFDEIERCQKLSPCPNFLVMTGMRYGWRPLPGKITVEEWNALKPELEKDKSAEKLVCDWYIQDKNDLEQAFYLRERQGQETEEEYWKGVEEQLCRILFEAAQIRIHDDKALRKFGFSATRQEICQGLFDSETAKNHTFVMIKKDYETAETEQYQEYACEVQRDVKEFMGEERRHQICEYRDGDKSYIQQAKAFLNYIIHTQIRAMEELSDFEKECQSQEKELEEVEKVYQERPELLAGFASFVEENYGKAVLLTGGSGSGKSHFLKHWAKHHPEDVAAVFSDVQPKARSVVQACSFCLRKLGLTQVEPAENAAQLTPWLEKQLSFIPKERKVMLILDCVENMEDWNRISGSIFAIRVPDNVILVITCVDKDALNHRDIRCNPKTFSIGVLKSENAMDMLMGRLALKGRVIQPERQKAWVKKGINGLDVVTPLTIHILAELYEELRSCPTENCMECEKRDVCMLVSSKRTTEEVIHSFLEWQASKGYKTIYLHALGYLALARDGLSEQEMIALLSRDEEVLIEIKKETAWKFDENYHIPVVLWARLYYQMLPFLYEIDNQGIYLMRFRHQMFYQTVKTMLGSTKIDYLANRMEQFFSQQELQYKNEEGGISVNHRKIREWYDLCVSLGKEDVIQNFLQDPIYIDCFIRAGMYSDLLLQMDDFKARFGPDRLTAEYEELLKRKQMVLVNWPESFLQLAAGAGLLKNPVLTSSRIQSFIRMDGEEKKKNGFYIPGVGRSTIAVNDRNELAMLLGGIVRIIDLNLQIVKEASCVLGTDDGVLYWEDDMLIFRGDYSRIKMKYTGRELYITKQESCPSILELHPQKKGFEQAGGWKEADLYSVEQRYIYYHDRDETMFFTLYYPPEQYLRIFRKGHMAAVLIDNTHIDVINLRFRQIVGRYKTSFVNNLIWSPSGRKLVVVLQNHKVLTLQPENMRVPLPLPIYEGEADSHAYDAGVFLENFSRSGLAIQNSDWKRKGKGSILHKGVFLENADRAPQLAAISVKADLIACYYRRGNESLIRIYRWSDKALLAHGKVDPIYESDDLGRALYFEEDGKKLVLISEGMRHLLHLETMTWKKEGKEPYFYSDKQAVREAYLDKMSIWIPKERHNEKLEIGKKRLKDHILDGIFERFVAFVRKTMGWMKSDGFTESFAALKKLERLPFFKIDGIWWMIDRVNHLIHVLDDEGNFIAHEQMDQPIMAVDYDDSHLYVLTENMTELISMKLER